MRRQQSQPLDQVIFRNFAALGDHNFPLCVPVRDGQVEQLLVELHVEGEVRHGNLSEPGQLTLHQEGEFSLGVYPDVHFISHVGYAEAVGYSAVDFPLTKCPIGPFDEFPELRNVVEVLPFLAAHFFRQIAELEGHGHLPLQGQIDHPPVFRRKIGDVDGPNRLSHR